MYTAADSDLNCDRQEADSDCEVAHQLLQSQGWFQGSLREL